MSAADEIPRMNTLDGTNLVTLAATGALLVIYGGKVVYNLYGIVRTVLLTFAAGDTAVEANLSYLSTLVMAAALNDHARGVVYKMYNTVGTGLYAQTAADTTAGVDLGDELLLVDADGISRTDLHTVTIAKASEGAISVAGVAHICRHAGLGTYVLILSLGGLAGAVAGNVCHLLHNVSRLKAHNSRDLLGGIVAAGNAEAGVVGFTIAESLCIAVTAGEAAGTAVGAGKAISDRRYTLVLLHSEENGGHGEKHRAEDGNNYKNQNRD